MAGARDRLVREHDLTMRGAWHTAALGRAVRMPELKRFLAKPLAAKAKVSTPWQEQLAIAMQWVTVTGSGRH